MCIFFGSGPLCWWPSGSCSSHCTPIQCSAFSGKLCYQNFSPSSLYPSQKASLSQSLRGWRSSVRKDQWSKIFCNQQFRSIQIRGAGSAPLPPPLKHSWKWGHTCYEEAPPPCSPSWWMILISTSYKINAHHCLLLLTHPPTPVPIDEICPPLSTPLPFYIDKVLGILSPFKKRIKTKPNKNKQKPQTQREVTFPYDTFQVVNKCLSD